MWAALLAAAAETPWACRPALSVCGRFEASPRIISVKKIPIESTWAEFWKVWFMPPPAPRCCGGRLFITAARLGEANMPIETPISASTSANSQEGEVDRQQRQQEEAERRAEHPAGREPARAEAVGEVAGGRAGDQHAERQRQHVDAGPQRRVGEVEPCWGSQMPCSQMISMNISPPRATAERNVESVPNVNARMRNSGSRNIGSATRRSIAANATRHASPGAQQRRAPAGCPSRSRGCRRGGCRR